MAIKKNLFPSRISITLLMRDFFLQQLHGRRFFLERLSNSEMLFMAIFAS